MGQRPVRRPQDRHQRSVMSAVVSALRGLGEWRAQQGPSLQMARLMIGIGGDAIYGADEVEPGGDQADELEAQVEEEVAVVQPLSTPDTPTRSKYLDHCVTHAPYRSWCRHCVEGRGREFAHATHQHGPREAPTVSLD